jgi:hypothetical protein
MRLSLLVVVSLALSAQTQPAKPGRRSSAPPAPTVVAQPTTVQTPPSAVIPEPTGVDAIVELVQAKMSESLILKQIQGEGKAYNLSPKDMLRLQKAGASEKIIEAMLDPASAAAAPVTVPVVTVSEASPANVPPAQSVATPQSDVAPAATTQEEKKGGRFSALKNRLKQTGKRSVDSTAATLDRSTERTIAGAESSVDRSLESSQNKVDRSVEGAQQKVDTKVSNATGAGTQKVENTGRPATKR